MSFDTAITINIISTFLMLLAYTYLFIQYRHTYLAKWVTAWGLLALRQNFLDKAFVMHTAQPTMVALYGFLSVSYCLFMIGGTLEFVGRRLSRLWLAAAFICLLFFSVGDLLDLPFPIYGAPGILFMGWAYIATGLIFCKIDVRGLGKSITGLVFILLGIHLFDMPFLFPVEWFAPWGFLIDGILKFVAALGIIFVFFEKVRNELVEQEKYYRLLTENATDVIYRYRFNPARFEYISPAVTRLTGHKPDNFTTIRQVIRIIHPDDRPKFLELLKGSLLFDGIATMRLINKSGDAVWTEQKYSVVTDAEGRPIAVEGIVRDVTKRVVLEQEVARFDRLNIVGQMAANLAHEVRNPLTTIRGYLQLLGNKDEFRHYRGQLGLLLEELDRTNHIITEYLALSKDKVVDMKKCNLNNIIQAIYPLLQSDAVASKIEVSLSLAEIPELYLDDKEIKQLVLNLTRNAIEAMPNGGLLEIKTSATDAETILSVKDQGKGIPHEVLHNLGKPFLTTKENGTGLGMAICFRIANRHNAKLDIDTGPAGTTIYVKFRNC
ncbi:MAG: ATP-binding protein [Negativicutes bacterium]|nr:ATP-binding protein [Negativicutes bacterium]